ncbi:MAG: RagB/SusD family nutrient uptake outer membrane protein [Bacteroidales bacterium]|nr:RagB/SusD family nutrient uptake outer membrane protein [Bacteroidales bacterium]
MKKYTVILAVSVIALVSCNKFLDMTPRDRVSAKTIWNTTEAAEYNINYLYSYIWDINSSPTVIGLTESLTDEMKYTSYNYNALCYIPSEMAYGGQVIKASYVDSYLGCWGTLYTAIRQTNEALNYLHAYGEMSSGDKTRLEGEIRFMRAYLYFELVKRYKSVIIYDEDLSAIVKDKALSSEEEAWDFIWNDLDFAAQNLPVAANAKGRLNKGIACGFITRAMLYAKRYDKVTAAAQQVKELGYELEENYSDAISKSLQNGNRETILQYTFDYANDIVHSFNYYYTPGGDYTLIESKGGAYGVPTQELVESYEYAVSGGFPDWTEWHNPSGTVKTPPYALLEPRFQATILYNGAEWKGRKIEPYVGGTDGWAVWKTEKEPKGKTVTGYYLRKLVDESYDVSISSSSQNFVFLRYAEVLLNAAEAYVKGSPANEAEANAILRKIRARVGLPYVDKSGNDLWKAIVQERKVELAFEGLRYWDLRRWQVSDRDYPEGLASYQQHGLKIEKSGDTFTYSYVSVDEKDRTYSPKLYQFPMPESELNSNSLVNQYDEWK